MHEKYRFSELALMAHPEIAQAYQECSDIIRQINAIFTDEPPAGVVCRRFGEHKALDAEKYARHQSIRQNVSLPQNADMVIGCCCEAENTLFIVELKRDVGSWRNFQCTKIAKQYNGTRELLKDFLTVHPRCLVIVDEDFYEEVKRRSEKNQQEMHTRGDEPPYETCVMTEPQFHATFFE